MCRRVTEGRSLCRVPAWQKTDGLPSTVVLWARDTTTNAHRCSASCPRYPAFDHVSQLESYLHYQAWSSSHVETRMTASLQDLPRVWSFSISASKTPDCTSIRGRPFATPLRVKAGLRPRCSPACRPTCLPACLPAACLVAGWQSVGSMHILLLLGGFLKHRRLDNGRIGEDWLAVFAIS